MDTPVQWLLKGRPGWATGRGWTFWGRRGRSQVVMARRGMLSDPQVQTLVTSWAGAGVGVVEPQERRALAP